MKQYKVIFKVNGKLAESIVLGEYTRDNTIKALVSSGFVVIRYSRVA
jgi:hypothetical protein